ncbi:MAG TPA: aspartyl protease family protein [Thermoanaerobaculia bacterium]
MTPRSAVRILLLSLLAGCALYSDVIISPLTLLPTNIDRGSDLTSMVRKGDYNRAVAQASLVEAKTRHSANELAMLGAAELTAGRYEDARRHLRQALDLQPFRTTFAAAAWDLSQVEYMSNNFDASLEWANLANEHGINVKQWHREYLASLSNVDVYHFTGPNSVRVSMRVGRPDVPRIDVVVNGRKSVSAVIDSGAVLSIVSRNLASELPVRMLGTFEGTFSGLLGEPIVVQFGILESVQIGAMTIANVPVAVMPDDKMRFLISGKKEFKMDFLLGAHLLKEFRFELDFRRSNVTFTRILPTARRPVADQNLFIEGFRPAVRGTVNRHGWFTFILDTGSEVTFLNEKHLASLPIQEFTPKVHNATLQGLGGAKKHGAKVENVEVGVDRWAGTFRTIPMYDSSENDRSVGIVGENYLKNFDVVIDFGRMRVDLAPIGVLGVETPIEPLQVTNSRQVPP